MTVRRTLQLALVLVVAAFTLSMGAAAGAVENSDYTAPPPSTPVTDPPTEVASLRANRTAAVPAAAAPSNQRLAITGSETTQLLVIGTLLVAGGAGLMVARRRTATA